LLRCLCVLYSLCSSLPLHANTEAASIALLPRQQTDFRVTFLKDRPFPMGTKKSKAVGEPPLLLAGSVWTAIRQAIMASRVERGMTPEFTLDCPASVDRIQTACAVDGTALVDSLK
jgi:xanthine dehydrogenase molybdopterin-binding subunit B